MGGESDPSAQASPEKGGGRGPFQTEVNTAVRETAGGGESATHVERRRQGRRKGGGRGSRGLLWE